MRSFSVGCILAASATLAACATGPSARCKTDEQPAVLESLYFGTATPDGTVTAEQWSEFLEKVVTPRFPHGLTVTEARGQWQMQSGVIERETTYVVQLMHPDTPQIDAAVREITRAYRQQFRQEAVLRSRSHVCTAF